MRRNLGICVRPIERFGPVGRKRSDAFSHWQPDTRSKTCVRFAIPVPARRNRSQCNRGVSEYGFSLPTPRKGRKIETAILKARRYRVGAIRLLRPRPFRRMREQTMIMITRRQAIGTMGTAAAFASGLARPVFADTTAGSAGIDRALAEA